jgi:translation initiation factor 2 alpha subunit (eIF-2alpha)
MSKEKLDRVLQLISAEKSEEAQNLFNEIAPEETVEYWMVSGKLEQKFQNWGKAMNAFSKIIKTDPENMEAKNRIKMIQSILNFWNPEMFNP